MRLLTGGIGPGLSRTFCRHPWSACDRKDAGAVAAKLKGTGFDVVYDINAREKEDIEPILGALPNLDQYILCSSAGVYLKSDEMVRGPSPASQVQDSQRSLPRGSCPFAETKFPKRAENGTQLN